MGKPTPFSPSPFPDSRDRFSAPVPSDWLLFPWKLLFAYSKPPPCHPPGQRLHSPPPKPPLPFLSPYPLPPPPPPFCTAAAEKSQVWEVLGRMRRRRHCGLSRGHGSGGGGARPKARGGRAPGRGGGCPDEKRGPAGRGQEHKAERHRPTGRPPGQDPLGCTCSGSHRCSDLKHPSPPPGSPWGAPSSSSLPPPHPQCLGRKALSAAQTGHLHCV